MPGIDQFCILVLEDDATLRASLARLLRADGHDVTTAATVAEALSAPGPFDVAILDLELPDGDGVVVGRSLVASQRAARVLFFSATTEDRLKARAAEFAPVHDKTDPQSLFHALHNPPPVLHILILEDSEILCRSLTRLFTARGHDVKATMRAAEALSQPGPYDVAILDLNIPDGSGIDVARQLLFEKRARRVIFYTGQTDPAELRDAEAVSTVVGKEALPRLIEAVEKA